MDRNFQVLCLLILITSFDMVPSQTIYDNLFGTCQSVLDRRPVLRFHVKSELRRMLLYSLEELLTIGYRWSDEYTQCIIGGLLESYEVDVSPELSYCDVLERQRLGLEEDYMPEDIVYPTRPSVHRRLREETSNLLSSLTDKDIELIRDFLYSPPASEVLTSSTPPISETGEGTDLADGDKWLLKQLAEKRISVTELSTAQRMRLKAYLQSILYQEERTLASEQTTARLHTTTPTVEEIKLTDDSNMEEMLRRLSEESMKEGAGEKADKHVGEHISDELKLMEQEEIEQYVDKKSASVVKSERLVEASDKEPELTDVPEAKDNTPLSLLDTAYVWIKLDKPLSDSQARSLLDFIADRLDLERKTFTNVKSDESRVVFKMSNIPAYNSTRVATIVQEDLKSAIQAEYNVTVEATGIGHDPEATLKIRPTPKIYVASDKTTIIVVATVLIVVTLAVLILLTWRFLYRNWARSVSKFEKISEELRGETTQDSYEDLCRQRMSRTEENAAQPEKDEVSPLRGKPELPAHSDRLRSPRSSTSSWSEEPVSLTMDISTGHAVLAYMEDHLKNSKRLEEEWSALESYVPDECDIEVGKLNPSSNRYPSVLPYDHNRVKLRYESEEGSYINASFLTDSDPRTAAYIATQGLLQSTVARFWQMIWEHDSTSIVMLTSLAEDNKTVCYQYWPSEGRHIYGDFEVHLVSEHIWCEAYQIRSLYLKNLSTNETRTVTQFHYLTWPEHSVPEHCKDLLDFRRKVNKSFRGKTSPITVCCSDGSGRTGTYILLDTVINRIHKGVKEIDIAATLEHLRDQRMNSVETKEQFEFVLSAVAEEVQALLKALPQ
ncbi:receptor-type tyrosine-protein phosphatase N2-like isoform X2 [Watersipora subatra]|uniref:receptor-type tyrosine-protein phosphatase N2-like isoform X2 n=1 Tax=Watersipora subatra TaxID=2589382 RepID=UPI00355B21FC